MLKTEGKLSRLQKDGRYPADLIHDGSDEVTGLLTPEVARFFYSAKAGESDRPHGRVDSHPTVKPVWLMCYLVRLVCYPGTIVLDPFMGSGSTGCAAIEEGVKYNIDPGEFTDYDPINTNVIRAECIESFNSGKDIEDNAAFYGRLSKAVTVRNLINPMSIDTVLRDKKDFLIKDLYVSGFGSPEMQRDFISGDLGSFHIGNMTDIYVKMPIPNRTKTYTVNSDARIVFGVEDVPVYRLTAFNGSVLNLPTLSFTTGYLLRFSKDERPYIQTALAPNTQVGVSFDTVDINTIDNYIRNSDNRVTTASLLVRGLAPIYVSFDIRYKLRTGVAPIEESIILEAARNYINSLPIGAAPEASDIDAGVRGMYGEIDRVVLPLTLYGKATDFEGNVVNISSNDTLAITGNPQKCLSRNTVMYIPDRITVGAV